MESERKIEKQSRQVAKRNTAKSIKDRQSVEAAEDREKDPNLTALYNLFLPSFVKKGRPKFITDKYGNRVRTEPDKKDLNND